jgi:phage baseplate assembly protein W
MAVNAGTLLGRGIAFPPRVGADGRVAWSEGERNVREGVEIILRTELDERLRLPEFGGGLGRFLFEPNTTATRREMQDRIVKALAQWEPRVTVESVDVDADPSDAEAAIATVTYRLVATHGVERVQLSVQLSA